MANEITFADLETNVGLAHTLAGILRSKLYDPTDLRSLMTRVPFGDGTGSETTKVSQYSRDFAFTSVTSETDGSNVTNSDIGDASYQLTVVRKTLRFELGDLWRLVAPTGSLDLDLLAGIHVEATGLTLTDMLCALFPSLTANTAVGSTTADMSVDVMDDAMFALNLKRVNGMLAMVLRPKAYNEWLASLQTLGGPRQYKQDTQGMLSARGPGFKGVIGDIQVWDSDSVTLDGGSSYYRSAMFGVGCFDYQIAPAGKAAPPPGTFHIDAGDVLVVHDYNATNAITASIGNFYPAVAEAEDARGVEIRSQVA